MADTAMPLVRKLDPETAHRAGVLLEKYHLAPVDHSFYPELRTKIMGLEFRQCVGLAAGFDDKCRNRSLCCKYAVNTDCVGVVWHTILKSKPKSSW